jgi:serine/threonine protein kinase
MSLCINQNCKFLNSGDTLFCKKCDTELLIAGRYQVTRLLSGDTGFANIYEVLHQGVSKVMKVLKHHDPKAEELFKREFQVLEQSSHSGIPKAEEYFLFTPKNSQQILHCLVMEKIEGIDLDKYIKQKGHPIDEKCALDWLKQLAHILEEIHNKQLLHRDIKPSNIILRPDGQLVLIDFGAVKQVASIQGKGQSTCIYTEGYAAPEQKQGNPVFQSDFFSIGRTFIYLLTSVDPSQLINPDDPRQLNWRDRTSNLSPGLLGFIDQLMEHSVEKRPRDLRNMLSSPTTVRVGSPPLDPNIQESDVPTSIRTMVSPIPSSSSIGKSWKFFVAAVVLLVLGGTAWIIMGGGKSNSKISDALSPSVVTPSPSVVSSPSVISTLPTPKCSASGLVKKSGNLYGVIEVGSTGIKAEVIQDLEKPNENGFTLIAREEKIKERNTEPKKPETQAGSVKAVEDVFLEIQKRFQIPCEQIVVYGSSGFAKAPHKDAFAKEIQEKIGREMKIISVEDESIFGFEGTVPDWRRDQVVTVDIGSGNIKGAYLENPNTNNEKHITYESPWGTKTFAKRIKDLQGENSFIAIAKSERENTLVLQIREIIQLKSGLQALPRVYLAGGITWALFTLVRPCQVQEAIKNTKDERIALYGMIYVEDINTFYNNATRDQKTLFNPDLSQCTPEQRQEAQKDINKLKSGDPFSVEQLIAGSEILRALSDELRFSQKDAIFFARYTINSIPIGYLKQQLSIAAKRVSK